MSLIRRIALATVAGAFLFGAGWLSHKAPPQVNTSPQTQKQVVTQEHVITKVVRQEVHAHDGTTKTTTTTTTTSDKEAQSAQSHTKSMASAEQAYRPNWSLGLDWAPRVDKDVYKPTAIEIGRRLWQTNAWLTASYDWQTHSTLLGFRVEF